MPRNITLTSSTIKKEKERVYDLGCILSYHPVAPLLMDSAEQNPLFGDPGGFIISGSLGSEELESRKWVDPPHKALANLPAQPFIGMKSAEAFIKKYGVLRFDTDFNPQTASALYSSGPQNFAPGSTFSVNSWEMYWAQHTLRQAWDEEPAAIARIEHDAAGDLEILPLTDSRRRKGGGAFELRAKNLWNFICLLFLRDRDLGRLGKCLNPGCPAKYYVKRRRTQKFCEQGSCTGYAQRKYALRWWQEVGQRRRAEESDRRTNSKERKRRRQ